MAHTLTQMAEFYVDTLTTTPVLLGKYVEGVDYIKLRRKVESGNVKIRNLVHFEADDLSECDQATADEYGVGIVPDTAFNRRQLEKDNNADWSYALAFSTATVIDIFIPINNIVVSAELTAANEIDPTVTLQCDNSGLVGLRAVAKPSIGRPLCIVNTGTGTAVIPMVLFGCQVPTVDA